MDISGADDEVARYCKELITDLLRCRSGLREHVTAEPTRSIMQATIQALYRPTPC